MAFKSAAYVPLLQLVANLVELGMTDVLLIQWMGEIGHLVGMHRYPLLESSLDITNLDNCMMMAT